MQIHNNNLKEVSFVILSIYFKSSDFKEKERKQNAFIYKMT